MGIHRSYAPTPGMATECILPGNPLHRMGRALTASRKRAKLSQVELGKLTGIGFQQISKYECGDNAIPAVSLYKLAVVLKCKVSDFYVFFPLSEEV